GIVAGVFRKPSGTTREEPCATAPLHDLSGFLFFFCFCKAVGPATFKVLPVTKSPSNRFLNRFNRRCTPPRKRSFSWRGPAPLTRAYPSAFPDSFRTASTFR